MSRTKQQIAADLRNLADVMADLGADMEYQGGFGIEATRGLQLLGDARVVRWWASDYETEQSSVAAPPADFGETSMSIIKPTIGRVVWFVPSHAPDRLPQEQPNAALIAYVHGDSCINVGGFDPNGNHFAACSVPLLQEGDAVPATGYYAMWMPYQVGQAKKAEV